MVTGTVSRRKDRPVLWAVLVAVLTIIALIGAGFFIKHASDEVFAFADDSEQKKEGTTEEEQEGKLINTSLEIPAMTFMKNVADNPPEGLSSPSADFAGNPNNALSWICGYAPSQLPVASVNLSHPSEKASVTLQAFGAGQGGVAMDNALSEVSGCDNRNGSGGIYASGSPVNETRGFVATSVTAGERQYVTFFLRGDVLVSVSAPSFDTARNISRAYDDVIVNFLTPVCEDLSVETDDSKRNPYYNRDAYTGWHRGREVRINAESSAKLMPGFLTTEEGNSGSSLPQGFFPEDSGIYVRNIEDAKPLEYPTIKEYSRPLAPVPVEMPENEVPEPSEMPKAPTKPETSRTIPERVKDPVGPGCGWAFTELAAPVFDDEEEKARADKQEKEVRAEMRQNYLNFLSERRDFILAYAEYSRQVAAYRKYAEQVQEVGEQWEYINKVRAEYRARLDEYWRLVEARESFAERQEQAQEEYDAAVQQCRDNLDNEIEQWREDQAEYERLVREREEAIERAREQEEREEDEEQETPTPSPSPTTQPEPEVVIPPQPVPPGPMPTLEDCIPARPAILDQTLPAQPVPPAQPEDVPLPSSWTDIP